MTNGKCLQVVVIDSTLQFLSLSRIEIFTRNKSMCIVIPILTIGLYGVTIESVTVLSVYLIGTYLLETIEVTLTTVTITTTIFEGIPASYCSVLLVITLYIF